MKGCSITKEPKIQGNFKAGSLARDSRQYEYSWDKVKPQVLLPKDQLITTKQSKEIKHLVVPFAETFPEDTQYLRLKLTEPMGFQYVDIKRGLLINQTVEDMTQLETLEGAKDTLYKLYMKAIYHTNMIYDSVE